MVKIQQILYLGLEVPPFLQKKVFHCPLIRIVSKLVTEPAILSAFKKFNGYTHLIFTSRNAVTIFFNLVIAFRIPLEDIYCKKVISVGQRTAAKLLEYQIQTPFIATEETAEGIIDVLNSLDLRNSHLFLPQSSIARPVISHWLNEHKIAFTTCSIYDTITNIPHAVPDLNNFDEIIFTSPSTVDAFLKIYGLLPMEKKLSSIGPVTEQYLQSKLQQKSS